MKRVLILAVLGTGLLGGCAHPVAVDRSGKLLEMTSEEAASISSTLERFTRQLNIANTQVMTGRKGDADKSLELARETLASSKDQTFDSFHRIAGWTAIAQLARAAGDKELALKAADEALAALNNVPMVPERAQYVLSLAGELETLKGKTDAIELIDNGAGWAEKIDDAATRRMALTAFAYRLVSFDAFEDARKALKRDPDAVWRTDTLLGMSQYYAGDYAYGGPRLAAAGSTFGALSAAGGRGGAGGTTGGFGGAGGMELEGLAKREVTTPPSFGKDVRFESVYKR